MSPIRRPRMARLPVGALMTLLAMAWLAPSTARAQCSRISHAEPAAASSFAYLDPTTAATPEGPLPTKSPCPGGSCSKAPVRPMAPGPVPPPKFEHWGCLPSPIAPSPTAEAPLPIDDPALLARDAGLSIFHPPRA